MTKHKRARDAVDGTFVTLEEARRRPNETVVETYYRDKNGKPKN